MSSLPISVFILEDFNRDFVWLERKPEFANVARPTLEQSQPVDLTPYNIVMVMMDADGKSVTATPATIRNAASGVFNVFFGREGHAQLRKKGALTYHVIAERNNVHKRIFSGSFEVTVTA